jgi:hypothetical protein
MKKGTIRKVRSKGQRLHSDSRTVVHRDDAASYRAKKEELNFIESVTGKEKGEIKFQSLGFGLCFSREMKSLSEEEWQDHLKEADERRGFYYAEECQGGGVIKKRKRWLKGRSERAGKQPRESRMYYLDVTMNPAIALTLQRLDEKNLNLEPMMETVSEILMGSFEKHTGYEAIGTAVHPADGVLHFHLHYSTISTTNEKLHAKVGVGNPRLPTAGHGLIGALRKSRNGLIRGKDAKRLEIYLANRERDGLEPIDWVLAQELDGFFELMLGGEEMSARIKHIYKVSRQDWALGKRAVERHRPRPLQTDNLELHESFIGPRMLPIAQPVPQKRHVPKGPSPAPDFSR